MSIQQQEQTTAETKRFKRNLFIGIGIAYAVCIAKGIFDSAFIGFVLAASVTFMLGAFHTVTSIHRSKLSPLIYVSIILFGISVILR